MDPIPAASKQAVIAKRRTSGLARFMKQIDIQLMVWPALILILIFSYIPMYGVLMAFQDYTVFKGFWHSPWVGLKHFEMFFSSPEFGYVMRNTIVISLLKFFIGFPAPIVLALMLNEVRHMVFKRVVQTISYLPHFLSWVIVAGFVMSMLSTDNGSVNMLLGKLNLIDEPVNFLSIPNYFWAILVTTGVWKEIGFASIVYLAAIAGIDPHLYEAAAMDGAGRLKQMFLITLAVHRSGSDHFHDSGHRESAECGLRRYPAARRKPCTAGSVRCDRHVRVPGRDQQLALFLCDGGRPVQGRNQRGVADDSQLRSPAVRQQLMVTNVRFGKGGEGL
ncbi:ABC transporter permease subunit [Paenibacillus sp. P25]|nr:ABC transporter permease subunit [Paenibacillus sp. P25]